MANRSEQEAQEHSELIRRMAEHFVKDGLTQVKADLDGYERPATVKSNRGEFVPDLTAMTSGRFPKMIVVEVETCNSIFDPHTVDQWDVLGREARIRAGEFHVAVPRLCGLDSGEERVKKRMSQLGYNFRPHKIWSV